MTFDNEYLNLGQLDSFSYKETFVHRLDSRIKFLVSLVFVTCVVSFSKYELSGLVPFLIYPAFLMSVGDIPLKPVLKKLLIVSPFVFFVGIFNPLLDREVMLQMYGIEISGGWISFATILMKFVLTVSTAFLLIATTSFIGICEALSRLRLPDIFVIQLLFLYRYLFVLLEEAFRMVRARDARSFGTSGYGVKPFVNLISVLLLRTINRGEKIFGAMVSRGFQGKIVMSRTERIHFTDIVFFVVAVGIFVLFRYINLSTLLGQLLRRSFV